MKKCQYFLIIISLVLISGCSLNGSKNQKKPIYRFVSGSETAFIGDTVKMQIQKDQFQKAVQDANLSRVRLIALSQGQSVEVLPEYRIFEIQRGSIYDLLTLQNGDIVLSAEDRVIYDPKILPAYLELSIEKGSGSLEVKRGERAIKVIYFIVK